MAVEVTQQPETADANKMDVVFHITEGPQIFVRNVMLTGLHYTRPARWSVPSPCIPAIH